MPKRISRSGHEATLTQRFGSTVRWYRQQLGVSQEELAWRADMHRTYLADVERGARNVSLSSLARLVKAIGVTLAEFFAALESSKPAQEGPPRAKRATSPRTKRKVDPRRRRRGAR